MTDIEKSWEETAKQINAKLQEAAAAVREANRLAAEAGLDCLIHTQWTGEDLEEDEAEMLEDIDVSDLEDELDQAGWSTSSSYC